MKHLLTLIALLMAVSAVAKDVYVKPHIRKDGTFVDGHYRSSPNSNRYDNYSAQGNYNPYTGQQGTVNPYQTTPGYPSTHESQRRCVKDLYGNCM
jgi:hypothetical protein